MASVHRCPWPEKQYGEKTELLNSDPFHHCHKHRGNGQGYRVPFQKSGQGIHQGTCKKYPHKERHLCSALGIVQQNGSTSTQVEQKNMQPFITVLLQRKIQVTETEKQGRKHQKRKKDFEQHTHGSGLLKKLSAKDMPQGRTQIRI